MTPPSTPPSTSDEHGEAFPDLAQPPPQWAKSFTVDGEPGGAVRLAQLDRKLFRLDSSIRYHGRTGLESYDLPAETMDAIRVMDDVGRFVTDLGSVPGPARWLFGTYGEYTPAVIFHDRLIPARDAALEGLEDWHADRYMRFMLASVGTRFVKRWSMWAAVALRSRFAAGGVRRWAILAWVAAFLAGVGTLAWTLTLGDVGTPTWAALAAPVPLSLLWGRQLGGGLVAAAVAPWFLPPTVLAVASFLVYLAIEWGSARVLRLLGRAPDTPGTYMPEGVA